MRQKRTSHKNWERTYAARAAERRFWSSSRGTTLRGDIQRAAQRRLDARYAARARAQRMETLRNVFGAWRSQVTPRPNRNNAITYMSQWGLPAAGSQGWLSHLMRRS